MKRNFLFKIFCIISVLLAGCAKTESENIKTSGFFAGYTVSVSSATPTTASCSASFTVEEGGTYIDLSDSDTVTCNGETMVKTVLGNIVSYSKSFSTVTPGATFTIVLTRSGESPYSASVTLPQAVVVTAPSSSFSQAKGAALDFSWTVSSDVGDAMYVTTERVTSGDTKCPYAASYLDSAPEAGSGTFGSSEMALPTDGTTGACSMNVNFERSRTGTMPSGLNGRIRALQSASVQGTLN